MNALKIVVTGMICMLGADFLWDMTKHIALVAFLKKDIFWFVAGATWMQISSLILGRFKEGREWK